MTSLADIRYRTAAFNWLHEQVSIHGDVPTWDLLKTGFEIEDKRIALVVPQRIIEAAIISFWVRRLVRI